MLQLTSDDVIEKPFPHVIRKPFFEPAFFARLKDEFPGEELLVSHRTTGRAGMDLYRGDPAWERFLAGAPAWRELYAWINSPAYLALTMRVFGDSMRRFGCRVDPDRARFEDHLEPREALRSARWLARVWSRLRGDPDAGRIFARMDLARATTGYHKRVHCDLPNRIVSMVVYLTDERELPEGGGELQLHRPRSERYEDCARHPHPEDTEVVATVPPQANLGCFFLCANHCYHGVTKLRGGQRDFVYMNLSSRAPSIW